MRRHFHFLLLGVAVCLLATSSALAQATIIVQDNDPTANFGFKDPTPVNPVGGNTGTTLGQQRLIAFQHAADLWGATLTSGPTIIVDAKWANNLFCSTTSATLGSAGANTVARDFTNAPFPGTWYPGALSNKLRGVDPNTSVPEIRATFNARIGTQGCLQSTPWYLGLDNNHGINIDLVTVVLHELGHGLGFQTFTDTENGEFFAPPNTSPGPSAFDKFLFDNSSGKTWDQMTAGERVASALNWDHLTWNGSRVVANVPTVLALGTPRLTISTPPSIAKNYRIGTATFGASLSSAGLSGSFVQALDSDDGGTGSSTDGCTALTNPGAVAGKIALIDRGLCGFTVKVKNAQNAGAIAVVIANNVGVPPVITMSGTDGTITIPSAMVSLGDGNLIKSQLGSVNGTMFLDMTTRRGADQANRALMFAPPIFDDGSSVSHFDDLDFPNQLMEPAINGDLTHNLVPPSDLTFSLLSDIGWLSGTANPIAIILEESSPVPNLAAAVDSVLWLRDPFLVVNPGNLINPSSDPNTRVVIFVTNLELLPGEQPSAVLISLTDSGGGNQMIPAQDVRLMPNTTFTQVTFKLPTGLPAGNCSIRVMAHSQLSGAATIRIRT